MCIRVEVCLSELNNWMFFNNFWLNNDKIDFLVFYVKLLLYLIIVGEVIVGFIFNVWNICVIFNDILRICYVNFCWSS